MKDRTYVKHMDELIAQYKKLVVKDLDRMHLLRMRYQVFQLYYGTINQFRPVIAKWIYSVFKPRVAILDFSSGWGGRLLAAMSMGIPYIGIDTNKKLEASYRNMIKTYDANADVKMMFMPSEQVDFSQFKYDLVFTSPPYFMIEEYEKMPKYESKQNFLNTFFTPVIHNVWMHLMPGGNMALNMPEEMFEAIKDMLPKIKKALVLPLSNRYPTNAVKQVALGTTNKERHEMVYVWHKQNRK
jgi:tRNA1(Val) A37 N6-methylase TrmN6